MSEVTTSQQPPRRPISPHPPQARPQYAPVPPQRRPPQQYRSAQPPAPASMNGLGIAALVLGILGLLFSVIPFIGVIAWPLVILGLALGFAAIVQVRAGTASNGGVAIAGVVLSLLGLVVCIVYATAFVSAVTERQPTPVPSASVPVASVPVPSVIPSASVPVPSAAIPRSASPATAGRPGDTLTADDMQVTATALSSQTSEFTGPMKCATVTYRNTGSAQTPFNPFDWTLQNPSGAITRPNFFGDDTLSSGELAPGGTTSGQVCFDAKGSQTGSYVLTYTKGLFGRDTVSWTS